MMTTDQVRVRLTVIVLTYRRDDALATTLSRLAGHVANRDDCLVILVDNNADGRDRSGFLSAFRNSRCISMETNVGVTGGRNAGIEAAEGDIVLFIDDDALIETDGNVADLLLARFSADPQLGILAFRSFVGPERADDPAEFPHTDKTLPRDTLMETFRFIGVAHAMAFSDLRRAGPYREEFFYGMEEFDMSFRFMKAGRKIVYDPSFSVNHLKAAAGRLPSSDVAARMFLNKMRVAWMHLPAPHLAACCLAWAVKTLLDTRSPLAVVSATAGFVRWARENPGVRKPADGMVIDAIKRMGGRPWK